jgi:hypothetical protein
LAPIGDPRIVEAALKNRHTQFVIMSANALPEPPSILWHSAPSEAER